jgi:hypothetical protein
MPDGFDPHRELERIFTLKELMTECRKRVPVVLDRIDSLLADKDLNAMETLAVCEMVMSRGFGKPRQHVVVADAGTEKQVKIYLPDNHRAKVIPGPIVDVPPGEADV